MTLEAYQGGSWKGAAPYVYHSSTWKLATSVEAYNAGTWKIVAQILTSATVTGDGSFANGTPVTLGSTVVGGYGTLTYLWTKIGGTGTISGSATGPTVNITAGTNNSTGDYRVTVTDSLTGTVVSGDGTITWGTPP